jgi:hypothetical protein
VKVYHRIHAACPGHAWSEMYVVSCVQEVGLPVVSSSCCQSRSLVRDTSVIKQRPPIHWLLISCIIFVFGAAPKYAYKIVVAVPTRNRLAFSPLDFEGWTLTSIGRGRCSGRGGKPQVGACSAFGPIVRAFISHRTLGSSVPVSLEGSCEKGTSYNPNKLTKNSRDGISRSELVRLQDLGSQTS